MNNVRRMIQNILAVVCIVFLGAVFFLGRSMSAVAESMTTPKTVLCEVTDSAGKTTVYHSSTYEETAGGVINELQEAGILRVEIVSGRIAAVNGEKESRLERWKILIFGEELDSSWQSHPVYQGDVITLILTK